jgi:hypothetical protein
MSLAMETYATQSSLSKQTTAILTGICGNLDCKAWMQGQLLTVSDVKCANQAGSTVSLMPVESCYRSWWAKRELPKVIMVYDPIMQYEVVHKVYTQYIGQNMLSIAP